MAKQVAGLTNILDNSIVNPAEEDGLDVIIAAIAKDICNDDGNVKEGLTSYVDDSKMDCNGEIKRAEDLDLIIAHTRILKSDGSGLSMKNLAFDESQERADTEKRIVVVS